MSQTVVVGNDRIDHPSQRSALPGVPEDFMRAPREPVVHDPERVLYDGVFRINADEDLQFQLRGHSINPLVDIAQPLFGLVMRLRRMMDLPQEDVSRLYENVRDHITALSEEVRQLGYDGATQLSFRYALCAFIDEAVMATPWGVGSRWKGRSLLSYHHNETWGGEKFFTVLARMQMQPSTATPLSSSICACAWVTRASMASSTTTKTPSTPSSPSCTSNCANCEATRLSGWWTHPQTSPGFAASFTGNGRCGRPGRWRRSSSPARICTSP